jgi:hypothetical protein
MEQPMAMNRAKFHTPGTTESAGALQKKLARRNGYRLPARTMAGGCQKVTMKGAWQPSAKIKKPFVDN